MAAMTGFCLAATAQPAESDQQSRFGNWRRDCLKSVVISQSDNLPTKAFKLDLLARGVTRAEASNYIQSLSQLGANTREDEPLEAAARLWLPHFISSASQSATPSQGVNWSSIQKSIGDALLMQRVGWEGLLVAHRKVAARKGQLPSNGECWLVTPTIVDGKPSFAFRLLPSNSSEFERGVFVSFSWERAVSPDGDDERAWACRRVTSSVAVATDGLLPLRISFVERPAATPLQIELRRGGRLIKDLTPCVAAELDRASTARRETIPSGQGVKNSLERSIDTLILELLKDALPVLSP